MQGAFLKKAPLQRAPVWMVSLLRALLTKKGPHFAKGSLLGAFCRGLFVEVNFAKDGSSSVQKRLAHRYWISVHGHDVRHRS